MTYTLPRQLTAEDVAAIAQGAPVAVDEQARREIADFFEVANSISKRQPVYGRSTGVGANRLTEATADPITVGMNLLRSHAVDAGKIADPVVTRGMLAVRLNQLLQPGSGIDIHLVDGLERMLAADAIPELRTYGSIGTADLTALAGTALTLTGERTGIGGEFQKLGPISSDSALAFMSSSAFTIAGAAVSTARLKMLVEANFATFSLTAAAARANPAAFSDLAARAITGPTTAENAAKLNSLVPPGHWEPARIQDPFAFRGFLPAISVVTRASSRLAEAVETLASASQENPRFFADKAQSEHRSPGSWDADSGSAIHHGGFLQNWLAHELDSAAIALAQLAPLTIARSRFLNDDTFSGLPRFLAPHGGGTSGTMMVEYVAASAMGEIQSAAAPSSVHSAVLSCGVEEDASFATTALQQIERALEAYEITLACETLIGVRALRMSTFIGSQPPAALARLFEISEKLPEDLSDRDLRNDIEIARRLLSKFAEVSRNLAYTID